MTQNRVGTFIRTLMVLTLVIFGAGFSALSAQGGKIDGKVKNAAGGALAGVTVVIENQSFATETNKDGYFFFVNVPAGLVNVKFSFIGYRTYTISELRVVQGQTQTREVVLESQGATQLGDVKVVATNPIITRDKGTSNQVLDPEFTKNLPETRINTLLALTPGVVRPQTGDTTRLAVRGSRFTENVMYVDGVPVQRIGGAGVEFDVAQNAFEDVTLTTGSPSAAFGNALGGVINVSTKTGTSNFRTSIDWSTGMIGGKYANGQNNLLLSFSGPMPVKNLTFSLSGRIEGSAWSNNGYQGWLFPVYGTVGVDTTFTIPRQNGTTGSPFNNSRADSVTIPLFQTAVISGDCDNFYFVRESSNPDIKNNYGVDCNFNRSYSAPRTTYAGSGSLNYTYGSGSSLRLSYNMNASQSRDRLLQDGRATGALNTSPVATLSLNQTLFRRGTQNLSVQASYSIQSNKTVNSPISVESEKSSRHPFGGFLLKPLDLVYGPENFPVDSTIIRAHLTQTPYRTGLVPNSGGNTGGVADPTVATGIGTQYPYMGDGIPYRTAISGGGSDVTGFNWSTEQRKIATVSMDAQIDKWNRIKFGGQQTKAELKNFSGTASGSNWYRPEFQNAFVEDVLDLSDVVLTAGLRWDRFNYNLNRWVGFPRISTAEGFDRDNPDLVMAEDKAHTYLAPRIQVAFPITMQTNFRLSYSQAAQAPLFSAVVTNHKSDIDRSGVNSRSSFGADVDFAKGIQFEFGVAHAFNDNMRIDVAMYNKDNLANAAFKFAQRIDPVTNEPAQLYLLQNTDFGNTRGVEITFERQIGQYLNGRLNYAYEDSRNTGSDPNAFLNYFEAIIGGLGEPPLQPLPTAQSRPHTLNGVVSLGLPSTFKRGTLFGKVFGGLTANATFQLASGEPYTRCDPNIQENVGLLSGGGATCKTLEAVQGYLQSRLPMTKSLNTSFRRNFTLGKVSMQAYLTVNNILNLTNTRQVYVTTGTTENPAAFVNQWRDDSTRFITAAVNHGFQNGASSMVLPASTAGCAKVSTATNSLVQSCFYWFRSEERFGNGDHVYTLDEWRRTSATVNLKSTHISNFVNGFRAMRFGLTVGF